MQRYPSHESLLFSPSDVGMPISVESQETPDPDAVQTLYADNPQCACCISWAETKSSHVKEPDPEASPKHAVVIRKMATLGSDADKGYFVHSITVNSELAKPILLDLFKEHTSLNLDPSAPTFKPPFAPFFDCWSKWEEILQTIDDARTKLHLSLIDDAVRKELQGPFQAREKALKDGVIEFDLAWALFRKGELIFTRMDGIDRLFKFIEWEYRINDHTGGRALFASCNEVEFNGHAFRHNHVLVMVSQHFHGYVDIRQLRAYPLEYHNGPDTFRANLIERGHRCVALKGIHCRQYNALASYTDDTDQDKPKERSIQVDERVMIDAAQYNRQRSTSPPRRYTEYGTRVLPETLQMQMAGHRPVKEGHIPLTTNQHVPAPPDHFPQRDATFCPPQQYQIQLMQFERQNRKRLDMAREAPFGSYISDDGDGDNYGHKSTAPESGSPSDLKLTEDELAMLTPNLKGYSLRSRKWLTFEVDQLREVDWNTQAFNQLALPDDIKELIQATIEMQVKRQSTFDDFIRGKGKGLITLLSGSAGIGKTATVEAMSEMLKVPLYHISAAGLGTDAATIDEKLREILKLTARWNAVLLLDEADLFLEQRTSNNIEHNAIVSTFLQTLEYHEGVLCMTTNRPHTLDRAILSRVHLNLALPDLDAGARKAIWRRFAVAKMQEGLDEDVQDHSRLHGVDLTEDELEVLAQSELDGRQIKNVFKTAGLLAAWKSQPLTFEGLKRALKIVETQVPVGEDEAVHGCRCSAPVSAPRKNPPVQRLSYLLT